ncbi:hypothetical protein [Aurantiacibacter poecillastricola]|uniref:hypothetical protein n=1 Tax=Aurantiacibacter poecillastricola TaxID=3064385 RepID=UPI00273D974F|nr:hypothetical protein [Aurantiacibacter sp. 219JJ12-13]MDP5262916.1 hypothetical protein [Aurantiacibacter sp. 219JJ12-13]
MRILPFLLAGAATIGISSTAAAQAPGEDSAVYELECDRDCLIGKLNEYVDALRVRTPSLVPLANDYLFTENNVPIEVGEGLWGTVDRLDAAGLEVADTQTQNAAWFGGMTENGAPGIFAVRIHVEDGMIDEIETVVLREPNLPAPFGETMNMRHDPDFNEILPPEQRRPRPRLRAIADSYFDTVELNDGQVFAPFDEDCGRLENGISTTTSAQDDGSEFTRVDGCEAQFELGIFRINKRIRERRYPIIDVERGVVVSTAFFDHANEFDRYLLTDGSEMRTALKWPNSITLLEAFRIKDAKISRIEAVFTYVPYFMHNPFAGPAATPPVPKSSPEECDTACLNGLTGQVLNAYATRGEWRNLPWAEKVGYEENSVGMQVNEGIWGSTTGIDDDPLVISDEQLGRALWFGRIEEHGQPAWAGITVSADGDRIGHIEAVIRREEYGAPYVAPETAPSFDALPAAEQTERAAMLQAVDRFYTAMNAQDGSPPRALAESCEWVLNGQPVGPCAAPFAARRLQPLERVRDREVIAVDEERGLVAMSTYEDFPATRQQFTDASGETFADAQTYPRTLQVVELFRFRNGEIERVEAITSELPYGMEPR